MISLIIPFMAVMSRLSGSGFGQKWNASWIPEMVFAVPFGVALSIALPESWGIFVPLCGGVATAWSYAFMQSGTWMYLKWTGHEPNKTKSATLKPVTDWIAARFGYVLGDEGYSWIAAGVKGFLIGLPVGGLPLAVLWPLGYELGTHVKGQHKDACKEIFAGAGAGIAIVLFVAFVQFLKN